MALAVGRAEATLQGMGLGIGILHHNARKGAVACAEAAGASTRLVAVRKYTAGMLGMRMGVREECLDERVHCLALALAAAGVCTNGCKECWVGAVHAAQAAGCRHRFDIAPVRGRCFRQGVLSRRAPRLGLGQGQGVVC